MGTLAKQISVVALITLFSAYLIYIQIMVPAPIIVLFSVVSSFFTFKFFQPQQIALGQPQRQGGRVPTRHDALSDKLQDLVDQQQNSYRTVYQAHPNTCHNPTFHYDWWLFPITAHAGASATSVEYSVDEQEIYTLLKHRQFMNTYEASVEKYLANLSHFGWNNYEIRFEKMMRSVKQFLEVAKRHSAEPTMRARIQKLTTLGQQAVDFAKSNHITQNRMTGVIAALENEIGVRGEIAPNRTRARKEL